MGRLRWGMTLESWTRELAKNSKGEISSKSLKTYEDIIDKSKKFGIEESKVLDFLDQSEIYEDLIVDFWQICDKNPEKILFFIFGMKKLYDPKNLPFFILKKDYSLFEAIFNFSSRMIKA